MVQVGAHVVLALAHVLLLHEGAVLLVDVAVGLRLAAGVGVLLLIQHQGAAGHGVVGHVGGGGLHPVGLDALGHGVAAVLVGAVELHSQLAGIAHVITLGDYLQGVVGAVLEAEVQAAIVHGGVHTVGHIAHGELVVMAFHDLQGGVEHRVVDGGGGLADTAAHLFHGHAAHIDAGGQVALVGAAAAGGVVIGEFLPGQEDDAVTGGGGQFHVGLAVGSAGDVAGGLAQQVGEKFGLVTLLGVLGLGQGQGDGEHRALRGLLVLGAQNVDIEVDAHHVVGDGAGGLVIGGFHHLGVDGLVHGGVVGLIGSGLGDHIQVGQIQGNIDRRTGGHRLLQSLLQGGGGQQTDLLPVKGDAGLAVGDGEAVLLQFPGHLHHAAAHHPVGLIQQAVQGDLPLGQGQTHLGLGLAAQQMGDVLHALGQEPIPADLTGVAAGGMARPVQVFPGQGAVPIFISQGDGGLVPVGLHGAAQGVVGLAGSHTGYIHAGHGHVGQDLARRAHPGTQTQVAAGHQHYGENGGDQTQFPGTDARLFHLAVSSHLIPPSARRRFSVCFAPQRYPLQTLLLYHPPPIDTTTEQLQLPRLIFPVRPAFPHLLFPKRAV